MGTEGEKEEETETETDGEREGRRKGGKVGWGRERERAHGDALNAVSRSEVLKAAILVC